MQTCAAGEAAGKACAAGFVVNNASCSTFACQTAEFGNVCTDCDSGGDCSSCSSGYGQARVTSEECTSGVYKSCTSGECFPIKSDGAQCSSNSLCASGACLGGYCCSPKCSACDSNGDCSSCSSGYIKSSGECKKSNGALCSSNSQCASGMCRFMCVRNKLGLCGYMNACTY